MKTPMLLALLLAGCGGVVSRPIDISRPEEAWNANNDPVNLREQYEVSFAQLPLTGELARKPWTDSYWPNNRGGLADRWNDPNAERAFSYALHSEEAVRGMTEAELALLSPAEKYDIFSGRFDYPLVRHERQRNKPDDPGWFGLCHGWAPAAINFEEPQPVTLRSAGGIEVPFGASDIKALLTFTQQFARETRFLGSRCNRTVGDAGHDEAPECRDTNAGSFHIVLANQIALLGASFVADMSRSDQVWNQPVFAYTSTVDRTSDEVYAGAAPGTVRIAAVTTRVRYIGELGAAWEAMPYERFPWQGSEETLRYRLELDGNGDIIGGEWDTHARPDFLWTEERPDFTGYFAALMTIYEASIAR